MDAANGFNFIGPVKFQQTIVTRLSRTNINDKEKQKEWQIVAYFISILNE